LIDLNRRCDTLATAQGGSVDWYMPNDSAHIRQLRLTLADHLGRHAEPGSDVDGAVLVASELVTNALNNSDGPVWISLDWGRSEPVLTVYDLGPGFELAEVPAPTPSDRSGRGLMIASHLVAQLRVESKSGGGSVVSAVLPVTRPASASIDPPRSRLSSLPDPSEMRPDGTYGSQSFLRALVVQLAQTVELLDGPDAAHAIVAQVGTDVGGRMEEAYRTVRDIDDAVDLDLAQIGDLFVELKAAIGGDFTIVEADSDRIVLENTTCPFGDAVQRAPALCRMTSSVFGGIARRNRGAAAVDLEQRIAVGDHQCRVTVWLTPPGEERDAFVHTYGSFDVPVELRSGDP
jgi:anti-sigma regulatory factor (Ser/Thr protein kinase)